MYEEEKIFGPLTLKQFLCVAFGIVVCYVAYSSLSQTTAHLTTFIVAIVIIMTLIRLQPKKISLENLENYFESKRGLLGSDAYSRMLQKKHTEVLSQINTRQARGLPADPQLIEVERIVASLIQKSH